jgi:bifunctional enzyme CysN/CysC
MVSFISPFKNERRVAGEVAGDIDFIEAYADTPIEIYEQRNAKGLYAKARAGEIKDFTSIDSPFEIPELANINLNGADKTPQELADELYDKYFD